MTTAAVAVDHPLAAAPAARRPRPATVVPVADRRAAQPAPIVEVSSQRQAAAAQERVLVAVMVVASLAITGIFGVIFSHLLSVTS